jgi:hypothetical protein
LFVCFTEFEVFFFHTCKEMTKTPENLDSNVITAPYACQCVFTTIRSGHAISRGFRQNYSPMSAWKLPRRLPTLMWRSAIPTTNWDGIESVLMIGFI